MTTVTRYRSQDFVHRILLPKHRHQWQVDQWCREQFGDRWEATGNRAGTWCVFWRGLRDEDSSLYEWLFVNKADAVLFALRWR